MRPRSRDISALRSYDRAQKGKQHGRSRRAKPTKMSSTKGTLHLRYTWSHESIPTRKQMDKPSLTISSLNPIQENALSLLSIDHDYNYIPIYAHICPFTKWRLLATRTHTYGLNRACGSQLKKLWRTPR